MPTARIVLTANNGATKQALKAIGTVLDGLAQLRRLKAAQDMMVNGESVVGTEAAAEYGLAGGAADGAAVCTIVATALTAMDVGQVQALAKLDQG